MRAAIVADTVEQLCEDVCASHWIEEEAPASQVMATFFFPPLLAWKGMLQQLYDTS